MPSEVALSGNRRSRFSAISSSSASASLSGLVARPGRRSPPHAETNGSAATDARAASTSRRLTIIGNRESGIGNRKAHLRLSGGVRDRQRLKVVTANARRNVHGTASSYDQPERLRSCSCVAPKEPHLAFVPLSSSLARAYFIATTFTACSDRAVVTGAATTASRHPHHYSVGAEPSA